MERAGGLSDAAYTAQAAGLDAASWHVSYWYTQPVSPHLAARLEAKEPPRLDVICADFQRLRESHDITVVEGAGGIVCPFRYDINGLLLQEDVIKALNMDTLIVGGCGLGSINAAALTASYLRLKGICARGFILNNYHGGEMEDDNTRMIELLTGLPVLARVPEKAEGLETCLASKLAAQLRSSSL